MRKKVKSWFGFVVILCSILGACQGSTPQAMTPVPTPRPTFTATPLPSATLRPWPTQQPTATATSTPLFPLAYEHVPTTPPSEAAVVQRARSLACEPPCWFGLEPGVSTLQDLLDLWEPWSEVSWEWRPEEQLFSGYLTNPAFYIGFDADRRGNIQFIQVEPFELLEYAPSVYFQKRGQPSWMTVSAIWTPPEAGEEWSPMDSFISISLYVGYPENYIIAKIDIGDTPDLGPELPPRLQACVPYPDFYTTYFAFPKETFTSAWIWSYQDELLPPARLLTPKEEIWRQVLEEKRPFCIELEFEG